MARSKSDLLFARVPHELYEQLRQHAEQSGESMAVVVRAFVRRGLEDAGRKPPAA